MLRSLSIRNFEGIKECDLTELGRVNVLIGRNNSGKSCILESLCLARCIFDAHMLGESIPSLLLERRGIGRRVYTLRNYWQNYNTRENIVIGLEFEDGKTLNVEISWFSDTQCYVSLSTDFLDIIPLIENKYFARAVLSFDGQPSGVPIDFLNRYPQISNYMRELLLIDDYLARKLDSLQTNILGEVLESRLDKEVVKHLNDAYGMSAEGLSFIPMSKGSTIFRSAITSSKLSEHMDDMGDGTKFATSILSACLLLGNSALLVDEIESHQHSGAIRKIIPRIVEIANEKNVQLFLTTHSLEVLRTLSDLPEKYDMRFFHMEMSDEGNITTRLFRDLDVKLLSDLGVDLRNLEQYKKFLVVEGKEDRIFIESILRKEGRQLEELGYLLIGEDKGRAIQAAASLVTTGKNIDIALDYDEDDDAGLTDRIRKVLHSRNIDFTFEDNIFRIKVLNSLLAIVPMGLRDDPMLAGIGITKHEMEDYCLKLIEVDKTLSQWVGSSLNDIASDAKKAGFEDTNKSKTLLQALAYKKHLEYEAVIEKIIADSDRDNMIGIMGNVIKQICG